PGLVFNAAFSRDPRADLAGRTWQCRGDPGFQLVLLFHRQPAAAAFMVEARQTFDPVFQVKLVPLADCVAVEKQHFADRLAAQAIIQQHQRVGAAGEPMRSAAIAGQVDQVATGLAVKEARADHGGTRVDPQGIRKGIFRISVESGYIPRSRDNPEFLWVDNAEVVRDLIAPGAPVPWD